MICVQRDIDIVRETTALALLRLWEASELLDYTVVPLANLTPLTAVSFCSVHFALYNRKDLSYSLSLLCVHYVF